MMALSWGSLLSALNINRSGLPALFPPQGKYIDLHPPSLLPCSQKKQPTFPLLCPWVLKMGLDLEFPLITDS